MKKNNTVVTRTSKELAEALGLTPADAVEWEVRIKITNKIISTVQNNGMTVTEIAKEAGTSRARVTNILKGNTFGISLDVLFRVLGAVGEEVKISFKKAA